MPDDPRKLTKEYREEVRGYAAKNEGRISVYQAHALLAHADAMDEAVERLEMALVGAALSLMSYDTSYSGGGEEEAFDIARLLGYEDDLTFNDVHDWLQGKSQAAIENLMEKRMSDICAHCEAPRSAHKLTTGNCPGWRDWNDSTFTEKETTDAH